MPTKEDVEFEKMRMLSFHLEDEGRAISFSVRQRKLYLSEVEVDMNHAGLSPAVPRNKEEYQAFLNAQFAPVIRREVRKQAYPHKANRVEQKAKS